MKDKAPIKRHKAIVSFSKDHHFGLLLVWKIRQGLARAISAERINNYVQYFFAEDLTTHFKDEEAMLFSLLPATDTMRLKVEADHAAIYNLVKELQNNKSNNSQLKEFADKLEQHIRFEEREFFNYLQNMPSIQLELIDERTCAASQQIDDAWGDCFWK